jgi:hypothetical protein
MYTNIPQYERINITHNILLAENKWISNDMRNMISSVLEQNYFQSNNKYYKQNTGLAIGAPASAIIAETHLQSVEHN